jgi:Nucleotidyltransferase domain/Aminoglycoside adenylyltransferase, C-terminal domain
MTDGARLVREFTRELADAIAHVAADRVAGVYLHGSAVLGDWNAPTSDVDVLVVVEDGLPPDVAGRVATVLASAGDCPGVGLEASVVETGAAADPAAPWPFVVHVTTAPHDRKTVWGPPGGGDDDLILHYAVTREHGWAALGPDPRNVVGAVPKSVVVRQLAAELRWAVDQASASYGVLNACRALRYRDEQVLCSKTDGGNWALDRRIRPAFVQGALDARRLGASMPFTEAVAEWILGVADDLRG